MPVTRQKKEEVLADLLEKMKGAKSVFFAKNLGLSVHEAQDMRRILREGGSVYRVAKKTLLKKAAQDGMSIEIPNEVLDGAVGAAFSMEDELAAIKAIAKFAKASKKIEIVGGIFEGKILSKEDAIRLSNIPSKEELLAKLLGSMMSPLSGFVGVGNQLVAGLARVIDGYREQKAASESA